MNQRALAWFGLLTIVEALFVVTGGRAAMQTIASFDALHHLTHLPTLPILVPWCAQSASLLLGLVWGFVLVVAFCGWQLSRALAQDQAPIARLLTFQIVAGAVLSLAAFSFSTDIYNYVVWGRLAGLDHMNPYLAMPPLNPSADRSIGLSLLATGNPPPRDDYGPLWTAMAAVLARINVGTSLWWQLWSHRAVSVISSAAASIALLRILRNYEVRERVGRVALFAFHPVVLYESAVGGHNDMLMLAFAAWSFAIVDDLPLIAGILIGASIAVKYVSVVLLPFMLVKLFRRDKMAAALMFAAALAVIAICFVPFWAGTQTLAAAFSRTGVMAMSPTWVLSRLFPFGVAVPRLVEIGLALVALAIIVEALFAFWKTPRARFIWRSISAVVLLSPVLQPWYATWLSPAIAARGRWAVFAWWLGVLVFLRYALDSGVFGPCNLSAWPLLAIAAAIVVIPVAAALAARQSALQQSPD